MKSVRNIFVAVIIVVAVLLNSCAITTSESQSTPQAEVSAMATEEVKVAGGDMFITMPSEVDSFDPLTTNSEDLINLLSLIYETPLKYESNGKLVNNLVERIEADETKTVFTFVLRDDVYFSDGTKLTSADLKYSAERVLALDGQGLSAEPDPQESTNPEEDPAEEDTLDDTGNEAADTPEGGDTLSEDGQQHYNRYSSVVASIDAVDELTVKLTMVNPGNAGLHFMTFPVMNETLAAQDLPVGTGPYMVEDYTDEGEMVLALNTNWWQEAPYIEKIVAKPVSSMDQKIEYKQSNMVDLVTTDVLYAGKYKQPQETQVIDYMTNYYDCIIPNQISAKLKDVNIRQAISYAIDRREILSTVLLNHGVPTNLPIAPDFYAYESKYKISDYDRKLAKELLEAAGYRSDPDEEGSVLQLDMIVPNDRTQAYKKEAAKTIKKQLAEVGIELKIIELETEDYMTLLEGGNFDLAYCSFYLDIVPDLDYLFGENGAGNYGHVQNDEINKAIEACSLAITDDEVLSAYSDLQRVLTERVPQIGLYYRMNSIICDDGIRNIKNPRQNSIYAYISEWYISYVADAAGAETALQGEAQQGDDMEEGQDSSASNDRVVNLQEEIVAESTLE